MKDARKCYNNSKKSLYFIQISETKEEKMIKIDGNWKAGYAIDLHTINRD